MKKLKAFLDGIQDFRYLRRIAFANRALQIFLAITLISALNFLAAQPNFHKRWDLSESHLHTLAAETMMLLKSLPPKVPESATAESPWLRVIVTFPPASPDASREETYRISMLRKRILNLVDSFKYATGQLGVPAMVRYEESDLLKNTRLLNEISSRGGSVSSATAIVVLSNDKCKTIPAGDLLKVSRDGANNPTDVDAFRGEEALLSAILEVTDNERPVIYALVGDGEARIDSTDRWLGLSSFAEQLRSRHMEVRNLNLAQYSAVPLDASMVLVAAPTTIINENTEEKLIRYLKDRNGRVLLLASPGQRIGLENLLFDWGVQLTDSIVVETNEAKRLPNDNVAMNLISATPHKITEILANQKLPLVASRFREVRKDIGASEDATRVVSQLVFSSMGVKNRSSQPYSWSECDYLYGPYEYNPERGDVAGPICIAAVSERKIESRLGVSMTGGRLIVVGSGDIASNSQLQNGGNKTFLLNAVNWLIERNFTVNVPPRPIADFVLTASMPDLTRVAWWFALLPSLVAAFGLFIAFLRRR
ncbi:MAG: GldG family protein [Opitutales bacterium]|nr:GldG family protein [Opitutales bacterium]